MNRPPLVVVMSALIALAAPRAGAAAGATPTAVPSPKVTKSPGFSAKIHKPSGQNSRISGADCNRRSAAVAPVGGQLGPNGPSTSQTLISVPIGGGNAASATRQQQISEACAHRRH